MSIYSVYDPLTEPAEEVKISRDGIATSKAGSIDLFSKKSTEHPFLLEVLGGGNRDSLYGSKFGRSFFADNADNVRRGKDLIEEAIEICKSELDEELRIIELDNLEKANYLKGQQAFWYMQEEKLGSPNAKNFEFPSDLIEATSKWVNSKGSGIVSMTESIPLHRNTGYPFFTSGAHYLNDLDSYLSSLLAHNSSMSTSSTYEMISKFTQNRWSLEPGYVCFKRPRVTSKTGRDWNLKSDMITSVSKSRGKAPQYRKVLGSAKWESLNGRSLAIALKEKCAHNDVLHTGSDIVNLQILKSRFDPRKHIRFSADISGMDTSCGANLIKAVWKVFRSMVPNHSYYSIVESINSRGAYMTSPWDQDDSVLLFQKDGGIASGVITTDLENSFINLMLQVYCYAKVTSISFEKAYLHLDKGEWFVKIKGDDSTTIVPRNYDFNKHRLAAAELGFKMDPLPGTAFLMTYFDMINGKYFGLVGRALMQTLWRENDAIGPFTELFGLITRWARCKNHPLYYKIFNLLKKHPGFEKIQSLTSVIIDSNTLLNILDDDRFLIGLRKELKQTGGAKWIIDTVRGLTRGTGDWSEASLSSKTISYIKTLTVDPTSRKVSCSIASDKMIGLLNLFADVIEKSSEKGVTRSVMKSDKIMTRFINQSGADRFTNINFKLII